MDRLAQMCNSAQFINLSMGASGVYAEISTSLIKSLSDLGMNKKEINLASYKICNVCIRCKNYIFCCMNKEWSNPDF